MRGGESCLEHLYSRRDLERPVWSSYISGEILYWRRDMEGAVWSSYISGGI